MGYTTITLSEDDQDNQDLLGTVLHTHRVKAILRDHGASDAIIDEFYSQRRDPKAYVTLREVRNWLGY